MGESPSSVTKGGKSWLPHPFPTASEGHATLFGAAHLPVTLGVNETCFVWNEATFSGFHSHLCWKDLEG